jgi:predicted transcriptional regulator
MARKEKSPVPRPLGPLELEVMKVVWEQGDVSVAEVLERLPRERSPHHNTVMTTMQRLATKGFLQRYARDGRTHGYRPKLTRDEVCGAYIDLVKEHFFSGSVAATVAGFLGMEKMSRARRAKLQKLLDDLDDPRGTS